MLIKGEAKMGRFLPMLAISIVAAVCLFSLNAVAKERPMKLWSPAFPENTKIPALYTCDGQDKSPPLNLPGKAAKADLERAMKGHIVGRAEMVGRYR
jgi:phosphatidylethanolamine-binding protein (PEBP) family uncharacterized protein